MLRKDDGRSEKSCVRARKKRKKEGRERKKEREITTLAKARDCSTAGEFNKRAGSQRELFTLEFERENTDV